MKHQILIFLSCVNLVLSHPMVIPIYGTGPYFMTLFSEDRVTRDYNMTFISSQDFKTNKVFLSHEIPISNRIEIHRKNSLFLYHPQISIHPTFMELSPDTATGSLIHCTEKTKYACSFRHSDGNLVHLFTPGPARVPLHVYESEHIEFNGFTWSPKQYEISSDGSYHIDETFLETHTVWFDFGDTYKVRISDAHGDDNMNNWVVIPLFCFFFVYIFYQTSILKSISNTKSVCESEDIHYFTNNNGNRKGTPRTLPPIIHLFALSTYFFQIHHPWRLFGFVLSTTLFLTSKFFDKWIVDMLWEMSILDAIWNCVSFAHLRINDYSLSISMYIFYFSTSTCWKLYLKPRNVKLTRSALVVITTMFINYWMFFCFENVIPWVDLYIVSMYQLNNAVAIYILLHLVIITYAAHVNTRWTEFSLIVSKLQTAF